MDTTKICILANCVHHSLALTLRQNLPGVKVVSYPLFAIAPEKYPEILANLATFDAILMLDHSEKFHPLDTATVRQHYGDKTYVCPTPFFAGQQPDMCYMVANGTRLVSHDALMGDYNSALLFWECQAGRGTDDIVADYVSGTAFGKIKLRALWEASLERLRSDEKNTEIEISPIIAKLAPTKQLFLSFNHPTEELICAIAESFAQKAFDFDGEFSPIPAAVHDLYADAFWPIRDEVMQANGMDFERRGTFKRPDRMGGETLSVEEFARLSCDYYKSLPDLDKIKVVTPNYLPTHLEI